jgi:hypothetical protein
VSVRGRWVLFLIALALLPVPVRCGTAALGYMCMPAPDADGFIHVYYEIEPLAIAALELATGTRIPVYYSAGRRRTRV